MLNRATVKFLFVPIVALSLFSLIGSPVAAQNFKAGRKSVSFISKRETKIIGLFLKYSMAISSNKTEAKTLRLYTNLLDEITQSKKQMDSLPAFKSDTTFKKAALRFMDIYTTALNDGYKNLYEKKKKAALSYGEMKNFLKTKGMTYRELQDANIKLLTTAEKLDSSLVNKTNQLDKVMKQADAVNADYNLLYLHFFKDYLQETDLFNAINNKDTKKIRPEADSLSKYTEEGLGILDTLPSSKEASPLVKTYKHTLAIYQKEASIQIPIVLDYFSQEKDLQQTKAGSEVNSNKTFKEYAKSIKKFNRAIAQYDKTMARILKNRKYIINQWKL